MNPQNDAYGQEIWAHFCGKKAFEVVERDDGFITISNGVDDYFLEYRKWSPNEKKSMKFVKGKVLDIGGGAGRVAIHLRKKGLNVKTIDNSPLAIKTCRARGIRNASVMAIEDIGKFSKHSFDTIILFGNNFGLFGSVRKAKVILRQMYIITSDDAAIIAECTDPHQTDNPSHIIYQKENKERGRAPGQIHIRIRFMNYQSNWFDYLFVSVAEMRKVLQGTGWKLEKVLSSKSPTYVAIIRKNK